MVLKKRIHSSAYRFFKSTIYSLADCTICLRTLDLIYNLSRSLPKHPRFLMWCVFIVRLIFLKILLQN